MPVEEGGVAAGRFLSQPLPNELQPIGAREVT